MRKVNKLTSLEHRPECYCLLRHVLTAPDFRTRGIIICMFRTSRLWLVRRPCLWEYLESLRDSTAWSLPELGVHFDGFLYGELLGCSISVLSSSRKYSFNRYIRRPHCLISVMSSVLFTLVGVGTYLIWRVIPAKIDFLIFRLSNRILVH